MNLKKVTRSLFKRKEGSVAALGVICVLMLAVIAAGVIVFIFVYGGPYEYLGENTFTYESTDQLNVTLDIYNEVGAVNINYNDSMTDLFSAKISIYGREKADITTAANFTVEELVSKIIFTFDSGTLNIGNPFDKTQKYYVLDISIHENATLVYDIETTTGAINADFDSTKNTTIYAIDFLSTTGSIDLDFGANTTLETNEVNIELTTGSISFDALDVYYTGNTTFNLISTTGSIDLAVSQLSNIPDFNYTLDFNVEVTTGNIDLLYNTNAAIIGIKIDAMTSTGSITLPGGGSSFETPGYDLRGIKYYFDLSTTTGNIIAQSL